MTSKLFSQALTKFLAGLVLVGVVLSLCQPEQLRKRLDAKEQQGEQKWVVVSDYAALHPHHRQAYPQ